MQGGSILQKVVKVVKCKFCKMKSCLNNFLQLFILTNYELKNLNHIKILSPNYGRGKILGKMIWEGMCKLVGLIL